MGLTNRPTHALAAIATSAMVLLGAGQAAATECRVRFTDVRSESYQSGEHTLDKLIVRGEHNFSTASLTGGAETTAFEIVDNDGLFTLATFVARWRNGSPGAPAANPRTIRVPRVELEALEQAMEMGEAYYARSLAVLEAMPTPREDLPQIRVAIAAKREIIREVLTILNQASDVPSQGDTAEIHSISWLSEQADRFRPGGDLATRYRDSVADNAPQTLCSPTAVSAVVRLVCEPTSGGAASAPARTICPQGLSIDRLIFAPPVR